MYKMENKEQIWKVLNDFRMKKFITETEVIIKVEEFDEMLDEVKKLL